MYAHENGLLVKVVEGKSYNDKLLGLTEEESAGVADAVFVRIFEKIWSGAFFVRIDEGIAPLDYDRPKVLRKLTLRHLMAPVEKLLLRLDEKFVVPPRP